MFDLKKPDLFTQEKRPSLRGEKRGDIKSPLYCSFSLGRQVVIY